MATQDRRVRKTRTQLKNALVTLLRVKCINEITIQELVDEADINRSTFYLHYTDIYDMLTSIEQEFFDAFLVVIDSQDDFERVQNTGELHPNKTLSLLFNEIKKNTDICQVLMGPYGDVAFISKMIYTIGEPLKRRVENLFKVNEHPDSEYIYNYCLFGCMGLIRRWFEEGLNKSSDEMAEMTAQLLISNMEYLNLP